MIDLATLTAVQGINIFGAGEIDYSGLSVSSAGDLNGDGFDDLFIGAYRADASGNAKLDAGDSYLIFGGESFPNTVDLATLGAAGITIFGADSGVLPFCEVSGFAVQFAVEYSKSQNNFSDALDAPAEGDRCEVAA